jgi:hypothetical protein
MLKLRTIGIRDYSVLEGRQRIGRIRFADERIPGVWLWNVVVHLTGGLPMGSAQDLRDRQGGVQDSVDSLEGPDRAGGSRGGLPGHEHPGRRLTLAASRTGPKNPDLLRESLVR